MTMDSTEELVSDSLIERLAIIVEPIKHEAQVFVKLHGTDPMYEVKFQLGPFNLEHIDEVFEHGKTCVKEVLSGQRSLTNAS